MTATVGLVLGAGAASRWSAQKSSHPSSLRPLSAATAKYLDDSLNESKAARVRFYLTGATNNAVDAWNGAIWGSNLLALDEAWKASLTTISSTTRTSLTSAPSAGSRGPAPSTASGSSGHCGSDLGCIKQCESHGNYGNQDTGGNGHYGAYQFSPSTWQSVGGQGNPADASPQEQDARAQTLMARSGPGQWACS